jgi:hypothetical protein
MKTHAATGNGACGLQSRTAVCRVIQWLENYVSENPSTEPAIEARNLIRDLEAVRMRPAVDELLALIGQIAKSDQGLQEIHRAKIRMGDPAQTTGEEI